jgi:hypothetical protein
MTDDSPVIQGLDLGEGEALSDLIVVIQLLTERIVREQTGGIVGEDLAEAWVIANSRFHMLVRIVKKSNLGEIFEDELMALGLVGPEMRFREEVLSELLRGAAGEPANLHAALRLGITVLRTLGQLPNLTSTIEATIGFCEGLLAHEAFAARQTGQAE